MRQWVGDLNRILRDEKAMHELDFDPAGFSWIDATDLDQSVVSLIRRGRSEKDILVAVFNFTPVPRQNYQIGIPEGGRWQELLNSDAPLYGGSGQGNLGGVEAAPISMHGHRHSLTLTLPPLGALFLKPEFVDEGEGS
jgi:1,4-alpha-glucan branching enzyme